MKTIKLNGEIRQDVGKKSSKQARRNDKVPAVLYGQNQVVHFTTDLKELGFLVYTPNVYLVDLNIDGKKHLAVIKDMQFHPVSDKILHVDFLEIHKDKQVNIRIPVQLHGFARGVQQGGKLKAEMRRVHVKGLVKDLPDNLGIDVTNLGLGQTINVRDLSFEGLQMLDPRNAVVVSVKLTRVAKGAAAVEIPIEAESEAEGSSEETGGEK